MARRKALLREALLVIFANLRGVAIRQLFWGPRVEAPISVCDLRAAT